MLRAETLGGAPLWFFHSKEANKHHNAKSWKEQLDTFSSILKLIGNGFRAVHYFQLSSSNLDFLAGLREILVLLTSFF